MTVRQSVGKQLHTLPSYSTLGEPQSFSWGTLTNKQTVWRYWNVNSIARTAFIHPFPHPHPHPTRLGFTPNRWTMWSHAVAETDLHQCCRGQDHPTCRQWSPAGRLWPCGYPCHPAAVRLLPHNGDQRRHCSTKTGQISETPADVDEGEIRNC